MHESYEVMHKNHIFYTTRAYSDVVDQNFPESSISCYSKLAHHKLGKDGHNCCKYTFEQKKINKRKKRNLTNIDNLEKTSNSET